MSPCLARILALAVIGVAVWPVDQVGAQACAPAPSGLVAWWDADGVSGTTAADLKGGSHGSIVGGVTVVPGNNVRPQWPIGNAFHFNESGYIDMGNPAALQFGTGPFSLEAWFLWDGGGSTFNNIIRKSNYPASTPGAGYLIRIRNQNTSMLEFFVGETVGIRGMPRAVITTAVTARMWHHAVGTKDPSGAVSLYLDGQLAGTQKMSPTFSIDADAPFTLGAWNDRFGVVELFSGFMDEISAYNGALTANEVQALFRAGSAGKCKQ
jgi:hypothetical protein